MIPTIVIVLVIYFAAMVGIGWYGRNRSETFETYLNMGRSGGVILLMAAPSAARSATALWSAARRKAPASVLRAAPTALPAP